MLRTGSFCFAVATMAGLLGGEGRAARGDLSVSISGRVVDKATGRGISGAEVVVTRSRAGSGEVAPPSLGSSTLRTDPDGRFTIRLSPEEAAEPRLDLTLSRVAHPGYIPRQGRRVPLATLRRDDRGVDASSFEVVTLESGIEYSGRVFGPDGEPAAGVPFSFNNWAGGDNPSRQYSNASEGRTGTDGRFRIRMPRTQALAIRLTPDRLAPYHRFWGADQPAKAPDVWAPADLGRLDLDPGIVLSGRLVGLQGRPLAGLALKVEGRFNSFARVATTDAEGRFAFAPLRPGNYAVFGDEPDIDRPAAAEAPVIRAATVYLEAGVSPPPLELHEARTVRVRLRFVDSRGGPFPGATARLSGMAPEERIAAVPGGEDRPAASSVSSINRVEPRVASEGVAWSARRVSGPDGLAIFRAPLGLQNADFDSTEPDEAFAFKTRLGPGEPLNFRGRGRLGDLDSGREGIEVVAYKAVEVSATITTADGEPLPDDVTMNAGFNVRGGDYGGAAPRLADGRFRAVRLMPDLEYEYAAWANGYVPAQVQRLSLPEGGKAELALVLRKKPATPLVGNPAPPFAVQTIDGRVLGLEEFRGKHLILHVWGPYFGWDRDLHRVDAIRRRFGPDKLAMIGLALSNDPDPVRKIVDGRKLTWPQAILRDRGSDPVILDYDGLWPPRSLLIGPDGSILARDLEIREFEDLVGKLLGDG